MTREAMLADLKRSGLTKHHADSLKLKVLTAKQTAALGHFEVPSYQIFYFDIYGKRTGYYRGGRLPIGKWRYLRHRLRRAARTDHRVYAP